MKKIIFISLFLIGSAHRSEAPDLQTIVMQQERTIYKLTEQLEDQKAESKRWRGLAEAATEENIDSAVVEEILQFFRDKGYNDPANPFARDPGHLKRVYNYAKKYKELLTPEAAAICKRGLIVPEIFALAWMAEQTHYNPLVEYKNTNGSIDKTISQINSACWPACYAGLPEHLKKKRCDPTKDTEIGVALFYCWINDRVKLHMAFAYAEWGWTLYARINDRTKKSQQGFENAAKSK